MIEETLDHLRSQIAMEKARLKLKEAAINKEVEAEEDEEVDEEEDAANIEDLEAQIRDIVVNMSENLNNKLNDDHVLRLMRSFLATNACQNRGFLLDGYPKTSVQARELFGQIGESQLDEAGEEEDEDFAMDEGNANSKVLPNVVFSLEATDEFLCDRVMKLPELDIRGTRYSEENLRRRLAEYRANNTYDSSVVEFFDEIEVESVPIEIEQTDIDCILSLIGERLGEPIGFGLTSAEEARLIEIANAERELLEQAERLKAKMIEEKASQDYKEKMEEWTETLEQLQMEEEKILTAQSEPLRFYLMHFVFPVLSKGLLEIVRLKPEDPVDYLAEYLFRENPEGRMFDPSYTRDGQRLLERYEDDIANDIPQPH